MQYVAPFTPMVQGASSRQLVHSKRPGLSPCKVLGPEGVVGNDIVVASDVDEVVVEDCVSVVKLYGSFAHVFVSTTVEQGQTMDYASGLFIVYELLWLAAASN